MAEVPLSVTSLEQIAGDVAAELFEQWAITDRLDTSNPEEIQKHANLAVDDALFVINSFMEKFNNAITESKVSQLQIKQ